MTAHEAVHLVSEQPGIAIFLKLAGSRFHEEGIIVKPLSDTGLSFDPALIMGVDESPPICRRIRDVDRSSSGAKTGARPSVPGKPPGIGLCRFPPEGLFGQARPSCADGSTTSWVIPVTRPTIVASAG